VGTRHHSKTIRGTKREAQAFEADQLARVRANTFTSPTRAHVDLSTIHDEWRDALQVSERTASDYQEIWDRLIAPTWGSVRLDRIKPDAIKTWVARLSKNYSASRARKAFTVYKQILDFAVMGERIDVNPASRAKALGGRDFLPKVAKNKTHRYLTVEEVFALAEQDERLALMIQLMAFTGVRYGEITALQVQDVDLLRSRLLVRRAFTSIKGRLVQGPPKNGQGREIPLPSNLHQPLMQQMQGIGSPDALLFPAAQGGAHHYTRWKRSFDKAVAASGIPRLTPHDLRHTYASISIQQGVSPKALQVAMGHSDIRLTMDTYAGLFETDRDEHARRLDSAISAARSAQNVRKTMVELPELRSRLGDLNPGPTHYECVALPLS
jgi:integrase